jgi:hypothetical protein
MLLDEQELVRIFLIKKMSGAHLPYKFSRKKTGDLDQDQWGIVRLWHRQFAGR